MRDFNDFTPKDKTSFSKSDALGILGDLAKKYEGKSTEEMMTAILAEAEKSRSAGKLKDSDIDRFYELISPLLDKEQRKMLGDIVDKLKEKKGLEK